jgi:hypothetical protein
MRLGLVVGFGAGYYLGAKAGTERYEELNRLIDKVRSSEAYGTATEKARAAVDLGVERVRGAVDGTTGDEDDVVPGVPGSTVPGTPMVDPDGDLPPVYLS